LSNECGLRSLLSVERELRMSLSFSRSSVVVVENNEQTRWGNGGCKLACLARCLVLVICVPEQERLPRIWTSRCLFMPATSTFTHRPLLFPFYVSCTDGLLQSLSELQMHTNKSARLKQVCLQVVRCFIGRESTESFEWTKNGAQIYNVGER
jgi:hypothetical protein